jgi:hypothetical protein
VALRAVAVNETAAASAAIAKPTGTAEGTSSSPWSITSGAFSSNTDDECDIIFIAVD